MAKYRMITPEIEAVQWSGSNWHSMLDFAGKERVYTKGSKLFFRHDGGWETLVEAGDWIVKHGEQIEFVKGDAFTKAFEEVVEDADGD